MKADEEAILEVSHLVQSFGGRIVLDIDHWSIQRGAHGLVQGPSGSGKSTLFYLIAGLMRCDSGCICVEGQDLGDLSARALDRLRGRKIGIVLQTFHLIEALDVMGNLRLAQSLAGTPPDANEVKNLLDRVGMIALAGRKPATLSQGERQRVAILRAVINRPLLLLADEPTSALDDKNAEAVLELLIGQADEAGATLLMASHDSRAQARLPIALELGGRA